MLPLHIRISPMSLASENHSLWALAITVLYCFHDVMFSHFGTIPTDSGRRKQSHSIYRRVSKASDGENIMDSCDCSIRDQIRRAASHIGHTGVKGYKLSYSMRSGSHKRLEQRNDWSYLDSLPVSSVVISVFDLTRSHLVPLESSYPLSIVTIRYDIFTCAQKLKTGPA